MFMVLERFAITVLVAEIVILTACFMFGAPLLLCLTLFSGFILIGDLATIEYRTSGVPVRSKNAVLMNWALVAIEGAVFTILLIALIISYQ